MFRREALDQLATPDNLNQLMQVSTPTGWLALIGLAVVLALGLAWGFLWPVPITVETQGLIAPQGGMQLVNAPAAGRVRDLGVKNGDIVQPGQTLATLDTGDGAGAGTMTVTATGP